MTPRDEILASLAAARRAEPPASGERREVVALEPSQGLVERFVAEAEQHLARVVRVADWPAAWEAVSGLLRETGCSSVLTWDEGQFTEPGLAAALQRAGCSVADPRDWPAAEVGITGADAGIAATGSLVLLSGPGRPRQASLLPPVHIALLARSRIVRSVEAWFDGHADAIGEAANVTLISGPSRSGDIEMVVTLGVHGPGELHIVLIDDAPGG